MADLDTPVSAFLKLRRGGYSFLLESVEGSENVARYSFIGTEPSSVLRTGPGMEHEGDPLDVLQSELSNVRLLQLDELPLPGFTGGGVGYVSYDCVRHFEPRTNASLSSQEDDTGLPEAQFMMCESIVVFDRAYHTMKLVALCKLHDGSLEEQYARAAERIHTLADRMSGPLPSADVVADAPHESDREAPSTREDWEASSNVGREGYEGFVRSLKEHICAGDIIQAVPSQRLRRPLPPGVSALDLYRQLRVINPSPYMFYVEMDDLQIVGASPEMLVKVGNDRVVHTHPIAGTRKRGATEAADTALAEELLADPKERAEHVMLVDLGRNDVGRVSRPGTVRVPRLMHIERYSHVMHIVSRVTGELRDDKTPFDAFRSIFPAGTVSGAPKVRAIELVGSLERHKRHIYAGAVGYFAFGGSIDTAIAIRTMYVHRGNVTLQAGGGIVFDSDPGLEYEETMNKLGAAVRAVDGAADTSRQRRHAYREQGSTHNVG